MQLREALTQISEIRQQMARAQVFRGYRAASTGATAAVAGLAAVAQSVFVADPAQDIGPYLLTWCAAAAVSVIIVGAEMAWRARRVESSPLQRQLTAVVIDQFIPSVVAGGLLTLVLARFAPASVWLLPGLWAVTFSLGVFASRRFLPRSIALVAAWYLLAGLFCLTLQPPAALSPWTMGVLFGVGQLLTSAVLYWSLERHRGRGPAEGE